MRAIHLFVGILIFCISAPTWAFETSARSAYVIDVSTGTTLLEKDATKSIPPASTSKLMTIAVLFNALRQGKVTLETKFKVSQRARNMNGSRMFLEKGSRVSIDDLIHGILVQSGNDACVVVAEGLAGTEAKFAEQMNAYAAQLGLKNSSFGNASGWPNPKQRMSAKDLAKLAYFLKTTYPEYWHYFSDPSFTYNGIKQKNRNPLIGVIPGADGLKTGHTSESGYSLVGSVERDGRSVIIVLMGLPTEAARASEAKRVADWAFANFKISDVFKKGDTVTEAKTWKAVSDTVPLTIGEEIDMLISTSKPAPKFTAKYEEPITAPLEAGTVVGKLTIEQDGFATKTVPLVTARRLEKGSLSSRLSQGIGKKLSELKE